MQTDDISKTVFVPSSFQRVRIIREYEKMQAKDLWLGEEYDFERVQNAQTEEEIRLSDCMVDGSKLALDVQDKIDSLTVQGFKVKNIIPITSGSYEFYKNMFSTNGFGYGFSYTEGLLIYAERA